MAAEPGACSSDYCHTPDTRVSLPSVSSSSSVGDVKMTTVAKREQKRRPKPKDRSTLICGVCGDKALGYNFDAITCESCKAFFRRNALKSKSFACSFDGNCRLDTHTRKFCAGCRLKKCFNIGMKKEWILTDGQLEKRRRRNSQKNQKDYLPSQNDFEEDVLNSAGESVSGAGCGEESAGSVDGSPATDSWKSPDTKVTSPLNFSETGQSPEDFTLSPETPQPLQCDGPGDICIKSERFHFDNDDLITPLSEDIKSQIDTLVSTYHTVLDAPYSMDQAQKVTSEVRDAGDLFNMTDIFIKRLIKFSKSIPEFRVLKQEDQIALLKGGVMEIMYLRSATSFDDKKRSWMFKTAQGSNSLKANVLNSLDDQGMNFKNHIMFVTSLHQLCRNDDIVLVMLFVIELFSPDRADLVNKELVSKVQEKFSRLMRVYLESQYTLREARILYPKLLMKLTDVRTLGEHSAQMAAQLDISRMEPLLVEVFNLKS